MNYYCQETGNSFDKILICGDIAFSGSVDEYKRANSFIRDLCKTVACKSEEVYTVPGNHENSFIKLYLIAGMIVIGCGIR